MYKKQISRYIHSKLIHSSSLKIGNICTRIYGKYLPDKIFEKHKQVTDREHITLAVIQGHKPVLQYLVLLKRPPFIGVSNVGQCNIPFSRLQLVSRYVNYCLQISRAKIRIRCLHKYFTRYSFDLESTLVGNSLLVQTQRLDQWLGYRHNLLAKGCRYDKSRSFILNT